MTNTDTSAHRRRSRVVPVLWLSGALAAVLLVLGVNGTLSSWTEAVINNDTNTLQADDAVVLTETKGTTSCISTDNNDGSNSYTCSTINKYGGTSAPLAAGASQSVTVTTKNTGTSPGALTLAPGACTKTEGNAAASQSICAVATVKVVCTDPSTLTFGPVALSSFTATQTVATLPIDGSTDCTFTVALPDNASPQIAGQLASQPLTWTLTAS